MTEQVFEPMRRAMVASQLRTTGVNDPRVVAAMGDVERERFVPENRRALAYADALVPLGGGRALNPPMAIGLLLTEARLTGAENALVIGAATGYAAAVLSRLVAAVTALEEDEMLAAAAKLALAGSGIELVRGLLAKGWPKGGPYDFILIDGAVEQVPQAIVDQARDGAALAFGRIENGVTRLCLGRVVVGAFGVTAFADAQMAVLPSFAAPRGFSF